MDPLNLIRCNQQLCSLSVYSDKEPITLMNLEPSTRYRVRVQLSRPGEGGEGAKGPEAIMETDCPGKKKQKKHTNKKTGWYGLTGDHRTSAIIITVFAQSDSGCSVTTHVGAKY